MNTLEIHSGFEPYYAGREDSPRKTEKQWRRDNKLPSQDESKTVVRPPVQGNRDN